MDPSHTKKNEDKKALTKIDCKNMHFKIYIDLRPPKTRGWKTNCLQFQCTKQRNMFEYSQSYYKEKNKT